MSVQRKNEAVAFDEYEAFVGAIGDTTILRATLLRRQRFSWALRKISLPDSIHIQVASEGSGSIIEGATRADGFVLFLQKPYARGQANGLLWEPGSVFVIPPGAEFCFTNHEPNDWLTVFIPSERMLSTDPTEIPHGSVAADASMLRGVGNTINALRSLIERFFACAAQEPRVLQEKASLEAFAETIVSRAEHLCGCSNRQSTPGKGRPPVIDYRLIASAVEMIEDHLPVTASTGDWVAATGVSESTLRRGFAKFYGVSPTKYIQLRRLQQARRLLGDCRSDTTTVSEVATSLGMWDFGRFACKYRQMFGENPSDTLRRERSTNIDRNCLSIRKNPGNGSHLL